MVGIEALPTKRRRSCWWPWVSHITTYWQWTSTLRQCSWMVMVGWWKMVRGDKRKIHHPYQWKKLGFVIPHKPTYVNKPPYIQCHPYTIHNIYIYINTYFRKKTWPIFSNCFFVTSHPRFSGKVSDQCPKRQGSASPIGRAVAKECRCFFQVTSAAAVPAASRGHPVSQGLGKTMGFQADVVN